MSKATLVKFNDAIQALKTDKDDFVMVPKSQFNKALSLAASLQDADMDNPRMDQMVATLAGINMLNYDIIMRNVLETLPDEDTTEADVSGTNPGIDLTGLDNKIAALGDILDRVIKKLDNINGAIVNISGSKPVRGTGLENQTAAVPPAAPRPSNYNIKKLHSDLKKVVAEYQPGDDVVNAVIDFIMYLDNASEREDILHQFREYSSALAATEALDEIIYYLNRKIIGQ